MALALRPAAPSHASALAGAARRRASARRVAARASGDGKPQFGRTEQQQRIADVDKAVADAQRAAGDAILGAMGPLAEVLGLKRRAGAKPAMAAGQPARWGPAREALLAAKLRSVTPAQAAELMAAGWVLIDVSPAEDFAEWHAAGSVSVPSVRYAEAGSGGLRGALRSAAFASLAVRPAEDVPREEFVAAAARTLGGTAAGVVVACAAGGTLRPTQNFPYGQASRSLFAAQALLASGGLPAERVVHLQGGLSSWFKDNRPGEGDADAWDARKGRVPSVGGPMYEQDSPDMM